MIRAMGEKRSSQGFTLIELLLSVAVLAFALSVILTTYAGSSAMAEASRNLTVATSHANYVLEDIRNTTFPTLPTNLANGVWTLNSAQITAKGLSVLNNEQITTVSLGGTTLLDVQVTVSWQDSQARSKTLVLRSLVGG